MIHGIFKQLCPNCNNDISSNRLEAGLPCEKCLPDINGNLKIKGELFFFNKIKQRTENWKKFFSNHLKANPWGLQTAWSKRVFLGRSFALLAPTGVGKTTFGVSMAAFLSNENKKTYIIVPTILLVEQIKERIKKFGIENDKILAFGKQKKKENKQKLKNVEFSILITTSMFLYKNVDIIPKNFDFIFVDDVDSFLKTAKNIDKVILLLGFSENDLQKTLSIIKLKQKPEKTEQDWENIKNLSEQVEKIRKKAKGVLVVSSATSRPKSNRVKIFKELLGFEVGAPVFYLRNIVDCYTEKTDNLDFWIKKLGKGGLVFIPSDMGKEKVPDIVELLKAKEIEAINYEDINDETIKKHENGEIDVIVGIASYRNPLARGFDLPHVVRYAIFYGVPKIVVSLKFDTNPLHFLWALASIHPLIAKHLPEHLPKIDKWINELKTSKSFNEEIKNFLTSTEIINLISSSEDITLTKNGDEYQLVISDATGYLQASGRTSRMYAGGITKGISLLLVDDKRAFNHLKKRVKWFGEDINFVKVEEIDLNKIIAEVNEHRNKIKKIEKPETTDILKPVVIVVESPNKARTIANFFGKPIKREIEGHELLETSVQDKYLIITASLGHILDLCEQGGIYGVLVNEHIIPMYEPIEGKESLIKSLRQTAMESFNVFVATDPDTEGEKIGWDIKELLSPFVNQIARMEFHEVTKKAIINALNNPRNFNENLVKAQIVRRVADRWIGFEYSQLLWKKFGKTTFSAGRVQTPVLGWIIKREAESRKKIFKIEIVLSENEKKLEIDFSFENSDDAKIFFKKLNEIEVKIVGLKEKIINPLPPFRTDLMLKQASDKYRFSLPMTMNLAQTLFEAGYITYHRTDSIRVSDAGISIAKEFISQEFGNEYFYPRKWAEGGAHECIRPTKPISPEEFGSIVLSEKSHIFNKNHLLLYKLIFNRFIASQMTPAKIKEAEVIVTALNQEKKINLKIEIVKNGWNLLLPIELHPQIKGKINVEKKKKLKILPKTYPYTQGELVQEMKTKGIGRPSTYATIIDKLFKRNYIFEQKGFLIPTKLGKKVYEFLSTGEKVKKFLSEDFTRELENLMDLVEEAEKDYEKILKNLYIEIFKTEMHSM